MRTTLHTSVEIRYLHCNSQFIALAIVLEAKDIHDSVHVRVVAIQHGYRRATIVINVAISREPNRADADKSIATAKTSGSKRKIEPH